MELVKKSIHMNHIRGKIISQITLDDDVIVPDKLPDIGSKITQNGNLSIDTVKVSQNKINVKGKLEFKLMYKAAEEKEEGIFVQKLDGDIAFDEIIHMDGLEEGDSVTVDLTVEDLNITVINSRKISVKALVMVTAIAENISDENFSTDIEDEDTMYIKDTVELTQIAVKKKDMLRVKEDINLMTGKLNVNEIIWSSQHLTNSNIKLLENKIDISGEISVFVLYSSEEGPLQWTNATVPFHGELIVDGCREDMIPNITLKMNTCQIDAKPDYDGEPRVLAMDGSLNVDIKLYEEQRFDIVKDAYSRKKELILQTVPTEYENIRMKNIVKCRVSEKIRQESKLDDTHVMQICTCTGDVKIDETEITDDGIDVDGAIDITLLYICSDDSNPLCCINQSIPFSQKIDVKGLNENSLYTIKAIPEQISTNMSGTDEIEVKATIDLDCIAFDKMTKNVVKSIEEKELDMDAIGKMPGIVAYVCKEGDTMWSVAKKFYTTVECIRDINDIKGELVKDQMVIVKKKM